MGLQVHNTFTVHVPLDIKVQYVLDQGNYAIVSMTLSNGVAVSCLPVLTQDDITTLVMGRVREFEVTLRKEIDDDIPF